MGALPDARCPDSGSFLVVSAAGQMIAQLGGLCFSERPNVSGLKLRGQAKEQSHLVELYQQGRLWLLEFAVPEPMQWTGADPAPGGTEASLDTGHKGEARKGL